MTDWEEAPLPREQAGGRVVLIMLVALVLLLGGGYAAAYVMAGERVPRGTTVAGVEIGGLTPAAASQALSDGLAERAERPLVVRVGEETETLDPAAAGLGVDYEASVAAAGGGQSLAPSRLWNYYTGGDDLAPVLDIDEVALAAELTRIGASFGKPAVDGRVTFDGDTIVSRQSRTGLAIDLADARSTVLEAYLGEEAEVELALEPVAPDIDSADVQEAVSSFANPALASSITLVFDTSRVRLQPRDFGSTLRMEAVDGELVPAVRLKSLTTLVDEQISGNGAPVDASFEIVDGKPKVVPAKPGIAYEPADVESAFLKVLTRPEGKREATVKATVAQAELTTKDARALGVTEQVSTFTTYYPYAEYRNINIGRAAEIVDGTVLEPGETFSLNDIVGERTRENGFTEGFIISDGVFKEELGGGVSQMATTLFNAMFFAGLKDVEHKPHSFYIDRYPVGREATVVWGALDLRFQNDTPYGVLVKANVTPATPSSSGVVTVSMWSTKIWDITTRTGERYNFTEPQTRTLTTEDCYPNEGYRGFDVNVYRYFRKPGESELERQETFFTRYLPADTVKCEEPEDES